MKLRKTEITIESASTNSEQEILEPTSRETWGIILIKKNNSLIHPEDVQYGYKT